MSVFWEVLLALFVYNLFIKALGKVMIDKAMDNSKLFKEAKQEVRKTFKERLEEEQVKESK